MAPSGCGPLAIEDRVRLQDLLAIFIADISGDGDVIGMEAGAAPVMQDGVGDRIPSLAF